MESNRLIVAIVIVMAVLFAYQRFLQWHYPSLYGPKAHHSAIATPSETETPGQALNTGGPTPASSPRMATGGATPASAGALNAPPERTVRIDTDLYEAILSSRGGRLISFELKNYRQTSSPTSLPYQVIRPTDRMPFGLVVEQGNTALSDVDVNYSTDSTPTIDTRSGPAKVIFRATTPGGLKLEKSFTFSSSTYVFNLAARATPPNGTSLTVMGLTIVQPLTPLPGYRDYPEIQADVGNKVVTDQESTLKKGVAPLSGPISYAGFGDRYFLMALLPQQPTTGTLALTYADNEGETKLNFAGTNEVTARVFIGPKAIQILEAADPALKNALDLGWWGVIALPFIRLLKIFYGIVPNYGVAIILLTVLVRLLTLPMSIRGQRSMMKMQRLQPQVEKIREKFKDDSERLNREMVELYKRNHVSPLGGCLPMLVQFPVFIGLYQALLNAVDLRHAPFFGWIQDLSAPECLHIHGFPTIPWTTCAGLPVLVGLMTLSTFVQQWLMPRQPDPSQQRMMMFMPLVFSVIFLQLPAGLTLYYLASNLLGIAQQVVLNREFQPTSPETK